MSLLESFGKAKEVWTNKKIVMTDEIPEGWTKNDMFHVAYHAINGMASRCIYLKQVPETVDYGNVAVFLHKKNQFHQIEATERGLEITVWVHDDISGEIEAIMATRKENVQKFAQKVATAKDKSGVIKTIIIEEKVDEVVNNAMNKEINRVVYFSIGKAREFAANIPLLMNASGFSLVQLSMNKWMTATDKLRQADPEANFPEDKVNPLVSDALKWKKYVIDFLNGDW